jgi:hypothetical protein
MMDVSWLAAQAKQVHDIFFQLFYILITTFLLLGVFIEYFKWPLGQVPAFSSLVGRTMVAAILLYSYPEVSNLIADVVDALSKQLGDLNKFDLVLAKMGEKAHELTWSWIGFKESIIGLISYITFFLLYISVYAIDAFLAFTWTILYVFSPLLIAMFVLPSTAVATKTLYKSLIEVALWKIVWSVLATLLWSMALSYVNQQGSSINFLTAIFLNLMLAGSLLLTPLVVHSLAGSGFASLAQNAGGLIAGATMAAPLAFAKNAYNKGKKTYGGVTAFGGGIMNAGSGIKNYISPSKKSKVSSNKSGPPAWHKEVPWPTDPSSND